MTRETRSAVMLAMVAVVAGACDGKAGGGSASASATGTSTATTVDSSEESGTGESADNSARICVGIDEFPEGYCDPP